MSAQDKVVRPALKAFADDVLDGSWSGQREREAVSLFAFGPLLEQTDRGGLLKNSNQVGIEIAIPQVAVGDEDMEGKKNQVCKDLVIWPESQMTCWDQDGNPTNAPAAVIEWKYGRRNIYQGDVDWLKAFTDEYSDCIGYAVTADQSSSEFTLSCTRVESGQEESKWMQMA